MEAVETEKDTVLFTVSDADLRAWQHHQIAASP